MSNLIPNKNIPSGIKLSQTDDDLELRYGWKRLRFLKTAFNGFGTFILASMAVGFALFVSYTVLPRVIGDILSYLGTFFVFGVIGLHGFRTFQHLVNRTRIRIQDDDLQVHTGPLALPIPDTYLLDISKIEQNEKHQLIIHKTNKEPIILDGLNDQQATYIKGFLEYQIAKMHRDDLRTLKQNNESTEEANPPSSVS